MMYLGAGANTMVTKRVDLQETQPQLAELLLLVAAGTEIILTEGDTPVARLTPITAADTPRIPGLHAGSVWMSEDFDAPLPDEFWIGRV